MRTTPFLADHSPRLRVLASSFYAETLRDKAAQAHAASRQRQRDAHTAAIHAGQYIAGAAIALAVLALAGCL